MVMKLSKKSQLYHQLRAANVVSALTDLQLKPSAIKTAPARAALESALKELQKKRFF